MGGSFMEIIKEYSGFITAIGIIFTVIALILAIMQTMMSRTSNNKILEISKSLSTRYLGKFPKDFGEIINHIDESNKSLKIIVDFATYGHYSNPAMYQKYLNKLQVILNDRNIKVQMIVYNEENRNYSRETWFPDKFENIIKTESYKEYTNRYNIVNKFYNKNDLFLFLEKENMKIMNKNIPFSKIDIIEGKNRYNIFAWIVDDEKLIFSMYVENGENPEEVYFYSQDSKIVEGFVKYFEINKS